MANEVLVCVLAAVSAIFLSIYCDQMDPNLLIQVIVQFLLAFGALALLFSLLSRLRGGQSSDQRPLNSVQPSTSRQVTNESSDEVQGEVNDTEETTCDNEVTTEKLRESRDRLQQQFTVEAADYAERIIQPRLDAKNKKKEEDFMRFMGPAWKGERHKLGGTEENQELRRRGPGNEGSSREAAEARQLPEEVLNPPTPPSQPQKAKRVISLPEEPEDGTADSVMIAFRTPISRVLKRRFLCTDNVQLLLDYVTTCGFSQRVYCICTSYPRQCISEEPLQTLRDLGITSGTTLYLEDK